MTLPNNHVVSDTGHTSDHNAIATQVNQNTTDIAARITASAAAAAFDNTVVHGSTAATARPAGATLVHWVGSVAPTNAATNDHWTDTTNKVEKYWDGAAWQSLGSAASLPSQTGNNGKFLTTDGSNPSWATVVSGTVPLTSANSTATYTVTAPTHGEARLKLTLTANCTISLTGGTASEVCAVQLQLVQDSTGSRTVTWPGSVDWGANGAPTLDVTAGKFTRVYLTTDDGGLSWQGALVGSGYTQPIAPSAPTSLSATGSTGQVALTWVQGTANGSTVTQNKIYRSTTTGTETLLTTISAATSYTDSAVTNGTQYFYKVTAVNALGESPLSSESSGTPGVTSLATDTFTLADTTTGLTGKVTDTGSKTWAKTTGTWGILTNRAYCSASSGIVSIDVTSTNVTYIIDYTTGASLNDSGVVFRMTDANNYVHVIADPGAWYVQKTVAGTGTTVANTGTPATNTTYTLKVVCNGTTFNVYINGTLFPAFTNMTIADAVLQTGSRVGLQVSSAAADHFWDNLSVTTP